MQFAVFACGCSHMCRCSRSIVPACQGGMVSAAVCVYVQLPVLTAADISGLRKWLCPVDESFVLGSFKMLQRNPVTT